MKKIFFAFYFSLFTFSSMAWGQNCGVGKIMHLTEGSYNQNAFVVRLDYSVRASDYPSTGWQGEDLVAYLPTLDPKRFEGIKALARTAIAHDLTVSLWSTTHDCSNASDFSIIRR